jgi:hypothetical protein
MPDTINACAPEPRSFSWLNAKVVTMPGYAWRVVHSSGAHEFNVDEFDMKIEFTRKPKPLGEGDKVRALGRTLGTIDGVADSYVDREFWVRFEDGRHQTYLESEVRRVDDDD